MSMARTATKAGARFSETDMEVMCGHSWRSPRLGRPPVGIKARGTEYVRASLAAGRGSASYSIRSPVGNVKV